MKYGQIRARALGRRVESLHFPPVWPADGIFEISTASVFTGEHINILIRDKFTGEVQPVPTASLPPFSQADDLYIDGNWSGIKATLSSAKNPSGTTKFLLVHVFPERLEAGAHRRHVLHDASAEEAPPRHDGVRRGGRPPPCLQRNCSLLVICPADVFPDDNGRRQHSGVRRCEGRGR